MKVEIVGTLKVFNPDRCTIGWSDPRMIWTYEMLVDKYLETKRPEYSRAELFSKPKLYYPGLKITGEREGWFKRGDILQNPWSWPQRELANAGYQPTFWESILQWLKKLPLPFRSKNNYNETKSSN